MNYLFRLWYCQLMVQEEFSEGIESPPDPVQAELQARLDALILGKLSDPYMDRSRLGELGDVDDEQLEISNLSTESSEKKRLAKKPDTDHLKPGTVVTAEGEVLPIFGPGDKIVVERNCSFLNDNPWLDTLVYRVVSIDDDTGVITCTDDELNHHAAVSFKSPHQKVFLCPKKGNPFTEGTKKIMAKEALQVPDQQTGEIAPVKKGGRGRPKGAKNRPKDVIQAEKKIKAEEKRAKAAKRSKK